MSGNQPGVLLTTQEAASLRQDHQIVERYLTEYRSLLEKLVPVLPPGEAERVKAMLHPDRSWLLRTAFERMREFGQKVAVAMR